MAGKEQGVGAGEGVGAGGVGSPRMAAVRISD